MPINLDRINPFFQVIILQVPTGFNLLQLVNGFKTTLTTKLVKSHYFMSIEYEYQDTQIQIFHILHKYFPSWYAEKTVSKSKIPQELENIENDLLIFYHSDDYIFFHTQCNVIISLVSEVVEELQKTINIKQIKAEKIHNILNYNNLQFRTLGILNIFNAGGTAPESKAYYSKNAKYCLSPSFDAGYGFGYCLGAIKDNNELKPFGCSSKKSKVWGTWVKDIDEFIEHCEDLVTIMSGTSTFKNIELLVSPISIPNVYNLDILQFYLDYNVHQKGMVFLEKSKPVLDWFCHLHPSNINKIGFYINEDNTFSEICIKFNYDTATEIWNFEYDDAENKADVIIWNETDDIEKKRRIDLVKYLNKQENFTILFSDGIAYRNNSYWEDTRIKNTFNDVETFINWSDVDIKKEDDTNIDPTKTYNILNKLQIEFQNQNAIIGINDNGANEIADLLIITTTKFILVHAKYSEREFAGLRVGDIQIVASQALKNIRYFISDNFTDEIIDRLFRKQFITNSLSRDQFKDRIINSLNSFEIEKECWIVQPGLSKSQLMNATANKIHSLLNFVKSVCLTNNIRFIFVGDN